MAYTCFEVSIERQVAHVVLSRPEKRNSMIPAFWEELPDIIEDIDDGAKARCIVISSTGPHFSSGLDTSAFAAPSGGAGAAAETVVDGLDAATRRRRQQGAAFYDNVLRMQRSFNVIEACRVPVLAAIQGGCIGGGVDFITSCDMRYATADAYITVFETNIGMTADVGTFPRLVKLIPEGIVRELAYTGRRMPAAEAQQCGLVNRVYADQPAMLAGVMEIAAEIAAKAPLAVYGCKRMISYARDHVTADGLDYISIWNASMLQSDEIREAMKANAERRRGAFAELPARRRRR